MKILSFYILFYDLKRDVCSFILPPVLLYVPSNVLIHATILLASSVRFTVNPDGTTGGFHGVMVSTMNLTLIPVIQVKLLK